MLRHHRFGAPGTFQVFGVFLKLGSTPFGGPIAHLGYFREEFVVLLVAAAGAPLHRLV